MEKGPRTTTFFALLFVFTFMSDRQKVGGTCRPCTQEAESTPICGSDQRTYSSRCLVQFARCKGHRVKIVHKGRCNDGKKIPLQVDNMVPASSACLRDRQQALSNAQTRDLIRLAVFVPKCEADGSYSQVQCLNTSHYCWCVDRLGRLIEGTRVRHSQPLCPVQTSQPSPTPVPKSWPVKSCVNCKGCPKDVRIKFNARIVELLSKEFMEDLQKASLENVSSHNKMGKVHLLLWKFTHLDTNADYVLEFKELQSFLKKTKKTIQPKKCSRTFMAYCDKDEDQKVSLNEWHVCFGVKEIKKCIGEYLAAVKASQRPSSLTQPYLPRCASDGSYYPTQCHYSFGYCWCVDVDSGKPIPNTTEKTSSLDCWQYTPFKNNSTDPGKKECALNLWTVFKRQLLRLFRRELEDDDVSRSLGNGSEISVRNSRSARSGDLPIHASFLSDNQVLIWKFNRLDRNRDKLLVPNEFLTPAMKKLLGKVKRGRKCSKKLINDCDLDKDKGLSLIEWTHCLRTSRRMPLQ